MADEDESTILSKLRIYLPDGIGNNTYNTPYTKISLLKTLNINAYSDTDMKLNVGWSVDGIHTDMIQEIVIQANRWYMEKIKIIMAYVSFGIEHITAKENSCLKITAFSPEDKSEPKPKPVRKSIFSMKKEAITSPKKEKIYRDDRIPHIIFKGGLLVGKDGRNVSILPKGNEGDILMIQNGMPLWVPVTKLFKNIDEKTEAEYNREESIIRSPSNAGVLDGMVQDEEIICDGIYDRSIPETMSSPKKPLNRPGSGLGNALNKSGLSVFGRNKSMTKKPPAFE